MIRLSLWGTSFVVIDSITSCSELILTTPAGIKVVRCAPECQKPTDSIQVKRIGEECLCVDFAAVKEMARGVNYTCELGVCNKSNDCIPSDLLIGCWTNERQQ
uniref:Evasin n=1 Tax=Rhipicephalus appendiculatus TaxID=34631 RepID=A0A131Z6F8_RHIAP